MYLVQSLRGASEIIYGTHFCIHGRCSVKVVFFTFLLPAGMELGGPSEESRLFIIILSPVEHASVFFNSNVQLKTSI